MDPPKVDEIRPRNLKGWPLGVPKAWVPPGNASCRIAAFELLRHLLPLSISVFALDFAGAPPPATAGDGGRGLPRASDNGETPLITDFGAGEVR